MVGGSREGRERRPIYQNGWLFTAALLGAKAIDGDVYAEHTLCANSADLADISLRQRILRNVDSLSLKTMLFGKEQSLPIILSPVGLIGM